MNLDNAMWAVGSAFGTALLGLVVWAVQQWLSEKRAARRTAKAEAAAALETVKQRKVLDAANEHAERVATRGDTGLREALIIRFDLFAKRLEEVQKTVTDHAVEARFTTGKIREEVSECYRAVTGTRELAIGVRADLDAHIENDGIHVHVHAHGREGG